jgi:hypothetical protein
MEYPLSANGNGIKIKPELMEKEKLYYSLFNNKVLLVFKDDQELLNCYEIEEEEIIQKVKENPNKDSIEKIFQDYIAQKNLKH